MSDPYFYREYECNISCPYFRARTIRCRKLIKDGCVKEYEGCGAGVSTLLIRDVPNKSTGRLILFFKDPTKGGYLDVFLSVENGVWTITPISQIPFNPGTAVRVSTYGLLVEIGSVADITWKYNGF